jgi:hypothetical protein
MEQETGALPHAIDRRKATDRRSGADRRRGRPPVLVDPSELSLRLPSALHDRLIVAATHHRVDVSVMHRALLEAALTLDEAAVEAPNSVSQK